jgi:hypothetical protein
MAPGLNQHREKILAEVTDRLGAYDTAKEQANRLLVPLMATGIARFVTPTKNLRRNPMRTETTKRQAIVAAPWRPACGAKESVRFSRL